MMVPIFLSGGIAIAADKGKICPKISVVSNFWESPGYFFDGTPIKTAKKNAEDFLYTYKVKLKFTEVNDSKKETEREFMVDLPQEEGFVKKECIASLLSPNSKPTIKNLEVSVLTIPAKPLETHKSYTYGKEVKTMVKSEIEKGLKARVHLVKKNAEYKCSPQMIKGPIEIDDIQIKVSDLDKARYHMNSVGRDRDPYNKLFEHEDPLVNSVWTGTTIVPLACGVKVSGR